MQDIMKIPILGDYEDLKANLVNMPCKIPSGPAPYIIH